MDLDDTGTATETSFNYPGEYEEYSLGGVWGLHLAFPTLDTASQRMVGYRVDLGGAATCYSGPVQALGGSTNASTGQTTTYWFDTGRWQGCVQ